MTPVSRDPWSGARAGSPPTSNDAAGRRNAWSMSPGEGSGRVGTAPSRTLPSGTLEGGTGGAGRDPIRVRGARQNNLAGVDVDIPRNRLVAITGVSCSRSSSLVAAQDGDHATGLRHDPDEGDQGQRRLDRRAGARGSRLSQRRPGAHGDLPRGAPEVLRRRGRRGLLAPLLHEHLRGPDRGRLQARVPRGGGRAGGGPRP